MTWLRRSPRFPRRTRRQERLSERDRTGEDQISLTDRDCRALAAHTHVAVGYNVQVAVDAKHKLMGRRHRPADRNGGAEIVGLERIGVPPDHSYFKIEQIGGYSGVPTSQRG